VKSYEIYLSEWSMLKSSAPPGSVIWITGLSDSGKTTLARHFSSRLRSLGKPPTLLDGDQLREVFWDHQTFDRQSRMQLGFKYASLCKMLALQGHTVIIATIALFREIHTWNRKNLPGYFEVYLDTPLEELRKRDSKGIYRRFDAGEISNVYGLDLKADIPLYPEFRVRFVPGKPPEAVADELTTKFIQSLKENHHEQKGICRHERGSCAPWTFEYHQKSI